MPTRFPFTKRSIEALPAHDPDSPSREAEYSDSEMIGLKLRVSKNGRRFFQHRYSFLGRKKCMALGEFPHVSVQDARRRVSENKSLLARDIDPSEERQKRRSDLTLSDYIDQFYIPYAMSHKKSWKTDVYMINHRIRPVLGKLRLSSISIRDITTFHSKEKDRNTAVTANHYLILVKRMFNLAIKWGLMEKNPAAGLDKFMTPPHRERYLTKEELPRFLKALGSMENQSSMAAIKLLLFTGCRKGEILSLRWDQVKLDEGRLFLPMTKNGRSRSVVLNAKAKEVLEILVEHRKIDDQYLFPSRAGSKRKYLNDLRKPFMKVCIAAGIDDLRIHDLRHSFSSFAVMAGASLYDVQKLLGHSNIAMTQHYSHIPEDQLQKASDDISNIIDRSSVRPGIINGILPKPHSNH